MNLFLASGIGGGENHPERSLFLLKIQGLTGNHWRSETFRHRVLGRISKRARDTMSSARQTTDHDEIRRWIEERQGTPSRVKDSGEGGILRIDFGEPEEALEPIGWDEFFQIFEKSDLAFLHQDETEDGKVSRFSKFVSRS
jgi:hypothetical protein